MIIAWGADTQGYYGNITEFPAVYKTPPVGEVKPTIIPRTAGIAFTNKTPGISITNKTPKIELVG